MSIVVAGSDKAQHFLLVQVEAIFVLRPHRRWVSWKTEGRLVFFLENVFLFGELILIGFDLFFSHDVKRRVICQLIDSDILLFLSVKYVVKGWFFPAGFIVLVDVYDFGKSIGIGALHWTEIILFNIFSVRIVGVLNCKIVCLRWFGLIGHYVDAIFLRE